MTDIIDLSTAQLKETCKVTGARWAAWLMHNDNGWEFSSRYRLSKARQAVLADFLSQPATATWLAGTFSSGRTRFRQTGTYSAGLDCARIFVFPELGHHSALLVGADQLEKSAESFFKVLSSLPPVVAKSAESLAASGEGSPARRAKRPRATAQARAAREEAHKLASGEALFYASSSPEDVPRMVLESLARSVQCDSAILSLRSGDVFRIAAVWNAQPSLLGTGLQISESEILAEMTNSRQGVILEAVTPLSRDRALSILFPKADQKINSWMGVPIVIGHRVIGHLAFVSANNGSFSTADLKYVSNEMTRLAYALENAIVFSEAARYLQQFALLNELASTASVGGDINEVARRIMNRLRKTFRTEIAGVLLLDGDTSLREYGAEAEQSSISFLAKTRLVRGVIKNGRPERLGEVDKEKDLGHLLHRQAKIRSILAVPFKYRGVVLGVMAMASPEANAFTLEDEQLLVVIASQLAGLFENARLNQETRERARNLSLIHQVVENVIGLTDVEQIAHLVAELMVKRFAYTSASVILMDENGQRKLAVRETEYAKPAKPKRSHRTIDATPLITLEMKDGLSQAFSGAEEPVFELAAASSICVPLKEGERILGVIEVERRRQDDFSENDLLALEALAGVLSSVVLSALRYKELQDSVRQLQAARETALDVAADLDLHALLKRVAYRAQELVGARGVELGLVREAENVIEIVVSRAPWFDSQGQKIPIKAGVAGQVADLGEPVVVDDYNRWPGRLDLAQLEEFHSALGIPLKYHNQVIGVLILLDDRPDHVFQPQDIQLLELLAPQLTVWIRNARLYQELQERIEAQRRAEGHLVRSARLAAVGEMAAGVAHELNNPLTAVSGFVELLLDELPEGSHQRPELELVLQEAQRARAVVRRLLDFSRQSENRRTDTEINALCRDVLSLVIHQARTSQVEVVCEYGQDLPEISVDANQIKQVLLNLLHNAIQAMPHGGQLTLTTTRQVRNEDLGLKDSITVSVADTGEGIPAENIDRIFEPFFTTRPAGTGTGLGLSVSYGIVHDHAGFIDVESQINQGSCFTVHLPLEAYPDHDRP
jgi:signal transduction histidine kinase